MNIQKPDGRLIYCPKLQSGQSEFKGIPRPSKEVVELIGKPGIDFIVQRFRELILSRKEMYGSAYIGFYGLHKTQRFFDLENRVFIKAVEYFKESDFRTIEERQQDPKPRSFRLSIEELVNYSIYYPELCKLSPVEEARLAIQRSVFQDIQPDFR